MNAKRKGKVKVYACRSILPGYRTHPETGEGLRQVSAVVAATSQKEAAKLLGLTLADFRWGGGETEYAPSLEAAAKHPGRVIIFPHEVGPKRNDYFLPPIEWQEKNVRTMEAREAASAEAKIRRAEYEAEYEERKVREAQADRAAREMIEREADILEDLGLTLKTDGRGNCTLPVETIIGLAIQAMR